MHPHRNLLKSPFNLFIYLGVSHGTALLPQDGNVKQEVLGGGLCCHEPAETTARPCTAAYDPPWGTDRSEESYSRLCVKTDNRMHRIAEQRERGHQKDGLMQSLSRSETHYGALNFAALLSQLEKGRPSKKVIRCSVASHWCNTWTVFQLPHCHSFTKPIGDAGTELYNLSYEICLEHASTSCNLS